MNILQAIQEGTPVRVLPYRAGSGSANALTEYINTTYSGKLRMRLRDAVQTPGIVLRWGKSPVSVQNNQELNTYDAVSTAANKHTTLNQLAINGVQCVEATTSSERASSWLADGVSVVCRHTLYGHSGKGIQIVQQSGTVYRSDELSDKTPWYAAKLFTKYFKRAAEYRVFVVGQSPVLVYRKGAASQQEEGTRQFMVRTHATGWNFCSVEMSDVPEQVLDASVRAVNALGLHFGAVDIGWNEHHAEPAVFEVNTAPGIQGTTVQVLGDALVRLDASPVRRQAARAQAAPAPTDLVPEPENFAVPVGATMRGNDVIRATRVVNDRASLAAADRVRFEAFFNQIPPTFRS
jgi:hypothetical protein